MNISLFEASSHKPVGDARVEIPADHAGDASRTVPLERVTLGGVPSYGNYVKLVGSPPIILTVRVTRPGTPGTTEAKFPVRPD